MNKRYPKIDIVNLTNADEEYSYTFLAHIKGFLLQTRSGESFKYAYKHNDISLNNYITAHQGIAKIEDFTGAETSITIYFSCSTAGEVMEVEFWL